VATVGEERSRKPRKFCQRRNRARNDHVIARWTCGYELLCSRLNDAKPRRESTRSSDCFKEASLLPCRLNQVKRGARTRVKEACRERNPREATATAEICKRTVMWHQLVNQRHSNKGVEKMSRRSLTRVLNPSQIDERIPRV